MYEEFYNLRDKPFSLVPDPDFLFLSRSHKAALNMLEFELWEQRGFTLLSGEVGSGKTILIRHFIRQIGQRAIVGVVTNTSRRCTSMLEWILLAYGLEYRGKSRTEHRDTLMRFLEGQKAQKLQTVLIIDEAHNLDSQALEELPALLHLSADSSLPLHLVLVGQPEIRETLSQSRFKHIRQLITVDFKLLPLTFRETWLYIRHRIQVVGGDPDLFAPEACAVVYLLSDGLPRVINTLCDSALVYGYGEERVTIDSDTVIDVSRQSAFGGVANIPGVPHHLDVGALLTRARDLCNALGPLEGQGAPVGIQTGNMRRPFLSESERQAGPRASMEFIAEPSPVRLSDPANGTEPHSAGSNLFEANGASRKRASHGIPLRRIRRKGDQLDAAVRPIVDEEYLASVKSGRGRKGKYVAVGAVAFVAASIAVGAWQFNSIRTSSDVPDSTLSASTDAGGTLPPLSSGLAASGGAGSSNREAGRAAPANTSIGRADKVEDQTASQTASSDEQVVDIRRKTARPATQAPSKTSAETSKHIPPSRSAGSPGVQSVQSEGFAASLDHPAEISVSEPQEPEPYTAALERTPAPLDADTAASPVARSDAPPAGDRKTSQVAEPVDAEPAIASVAAEVPVDAALMPVPEFKVASATPLAPDVDGVAGAPAISLDEREIAIWVPPAPRIHRSAANTPVSKPKPASLPQPRPSPEAGGQLNKATDANPKPEAAQIAAATPQRTKSPQELSEILKSEDLGQYVEAFEELFAIWNMNYAALAGGAPCHKAFSGGLSCYEREGSLAKLKRLDLPAVIGLRRPDGNVAYAVVAGISGSHAKLRFKDKTVTAPIGEVSSRMSGPFVLLWKSPLQFTDNMREGSTGDDVQSLRDTLDRIMPEAFRPGTGIIFDSGVTRAVKEFQKQHGLYVDGIVGAETLISINRELYKGQLPEL